MMQVERKRRGKVEELLEDRLWDVGDIDFDFENASVRVVLLQEVPELRVLGRQMGPYRKGDEVDVPRWVASEMVNQGVAKYRDKEGLSLQELSKVHWREALPTSRQIPQLEEYFYCKLRRLLSELKEQGKSDVTKLKEYEKALSISNDVVNCRLRKLVVLAASTFQSGDLYKNLTLEERVLLEGLAKAINVWRERILEVSEDGKRTRES